MIKNLSKLVAITMLFSMLQFPTSATKASAANSGLYEYKVVNGNAEITDYYGNEENVIIPSTIDGYTVTSIEGHYENYDDSVVWHGAFNEEDQLKSVTFPSTVTSIGAAFDLCYQLEKVIIGENVCDIYKNAFETCPSLREFVVSKNSKFFTSVDGVLFNKDLTELVSYPCAREGTKYDIPNSVKAINHKAFLNCKLLQEITIPKTVTDIGESAFFGCEGLLSIEIPNTVTKLSSELFSHCKKLEKITIPEEIVDVSSYVFDDTAWYNNQPDGMIYMNKVFCSYKGDLPTNKLLILKDDTKAIAGAAFFHLGDSTTVLFPKNVKTIHEDALYGCGSMQIIGYSGEPIEAFAKKAKLRFIDITNPNIITPTNLKATRLKGKKLKAKLTWEKVDGQFYKVEMSKKKKKGFKTIKKYTKDLSSIKKTGLKKNVRYYFRVKSYKLFDGRKYYSDYSDVLSIKI